MKLVFILEYLRWYLLIFSVKPYIPALREHGGGLVVVPAEKASLLGWQFDSKQCREQLITPLTCFPQSRCNSLLFRTPVLLHLLLDLDTYGGVDHWVFPLFLKIVADIIARKLSIIFRGLIRRGSFLECLQSAIVTLIPKGAPSPCRENYCPISPILSKVYEKLVYYKLSCFCENVFFPASQFLIRKVWAAWMHC